MRQNENMFTDDIVCPHCGQNEPQSIQHFTADVQMVKLNCRFCMKRMIAIKVVVVSYITMKEGNPDE